MTYSSFLSSIFLVVNFLISSFKTILSSLIDNFIFRTIIFISLTFFVISFALFILHLIQDIINFSSSKNKGGGVE